MSILKAVAGGLAGACVLTLVHETVRRTVPNAPRMDILGMQAIAKGLRMTGNTPPQSDKKLHTWAMIGDVVSNSLYYSFTGTGSNALKLGAILGAAAGAGAVLLPGPLGLSEEPSNRTPETQAMTVGLYLLGGLVAGVVGSLLGDDEEDD